MPSPFNTTDNLCTFCAFREGSGGKDDTGVALLQSVKNGEFAQSQLQLSLQQARDEIYARAGRKENAEYDDYRKSQLTECELYLATARLYERLAEKIGLKTVDANAMSVGSIMAGADTPSPIERMEAWFRTSKTYRAIGQELLTGQGNAWNMSVGIEHSSHRYPCLSGCNGCHHGGCSMQEYL